MLYNESILDLGNTNGDVSATVEIVNYSRLSSLISNKYCLVLQTTNVILSLSLV